MAQAPAASGMERRVSGRAGLRAKLAPGAPVALAALAACAGAACGGKAPEIRPGGPLSATGLPLAVATTRGPMLVEEEYLPGVVDCELAWTTAAPAALTAQAIAARTYLAHHLAVAGAEAVVPLGPQFQCWRENPRDRAREAVAATRGVVMHHQGALISANYAAGADGLDPSCAPPPPTHFGYTAASWDELRDAWLAGARFDGYAWTEIFITGGADRPGRSARPSLLGPRSLANRGAMSQHGAVCLATRKTQPAAAILRFYYGADIELVSPVQALAARGLLTGTALVTLASEPRSRETAAPRY
jgi:hypothetical protein